MIDLDDADDFTMELARLMDKYKLGVFIGDCQELYIGYVIAKDEDFINYYITDLLENTPRK